VIVLSSGQRVYEAAVLYSPFGARQVVLRLAESASGSCFSEPTFLRFRSYLFKSRAGWATRGIVALYALSQSNFATPVFGSLFFHFWQIAAAIGFIPLLCGI
jgi:hypothetical protein